MQFPDKVVVVHPSEVDEYGNPGGSFTNPTRTDAKAFLFEKTGTNGVQYGALLPPATVISAGDRLEANGGIYSVSFVAKVRSPARDILWNVVLEVFR